MNNNNINKETKMFDLRKSDVRRAKALAYRNPYTFLHDVGKILKIDDIERHRHLLFTRNEHNRFELQLRSGSIGSGDLVTHTILNDSVIPIYKDRLVKGDLIWLDKSDSKLNEDGTTTIFKKTGLCLVQGSKYFGYNLTSEISNIEKKTRSVKEHIYGFGSIIS